MRAPVRFACAAVIITTVEHRLAVSALVGYLASRCCVNHSVAGPAEASKSFT